MPRGVANVSTQLEETVTYSCPQCKAQLEAPPGSWDGWVRCPACARAFLPPETERLPRGVFAIAAERATDGTPPGESSTPGVAEIEPVGLVTGSHTYTSGPRLVFITGLVLCLFLSLIFFLVHEPGKLAIFGALTIGFFLLLLRTPRKRVPPVSGI